MSQPPTGSPSDGGPEWLSKVFQLSWDSTVNLLSSLQGNRSVSNNATYESEEVSELQRLKARSREQRVIEANKIWNKGDIIANWKDCKNSRRVRELVWHGIPPKHRAVVWPLMLNNNLNLTPELYKIYCDQAQRTHKLSEEKPIGKEGSVKLISLDLPRTFPALSFFEEGCPMHTDLERVLMAYVCYRPDIGYVQGMSYLAAVLLLSLEEAMAFQCLANLLNCPLLLSFYRLDLTMIEEFIKVLVILMREHLPRLQEYLDSLDITAHVFVMDWVLTLFTKSLPLDHATRIWDMYFLDGEIFIFRTIIGILKWASKQLLESRYDQCLILLTHLPEDIDETSLFNCIRSIKLDPRTCKELSEFLLKNARK